MNSCVGPARELSFRQLQPFIWQRNTADFEESANSPPSGEKAKAVGEPAFRMIFLGSAQVSTFQIRISPVEVAAASDLPSGENTTLSTVLLLFSARFATQMCTLVRSDAFQTLTPLSSFQPYPAARNCPSGEKATAFTRSGQSSFAINASEETSAKDVPARRIGQKNTPRNLPERLALRVDKTHLFGPHFELLRHQI